MFSGGLVVVAIFLAAFIYRIVLVARNPHRLDAYVTNTPVRLLRNLGILLMVLGLIGSFGIFFIGPLAMGIFGKAGDGGIAFFVVGLVVSLISSAGLSGLLAFEASRLFGFESRLDDEGDLANNNEIQPARSSAR
jgi:hypothetical protein